MFGRFAVALLAILALAAAQPPAAQDALGSWEDLPEGAQFDPEFIYAHQDRSASVTLKESGLERIALVTVH
jgi:hypothetical protein